MRPQSGTQGGIVRVEVFAYSRSDQLLDLLLNNRAFSKERQLRLDRSHCPTGLEPVPSQALQCPRICQALSGLGIEACAQAQIGNIAEWLLPAGLLDCASSFLGQTPYHTQPHPDSRQRAISNAFEAAIPIAAGHIYGQGLQAMASGVLQDLVGAVEAHGVGVDQRCSKSRRLMAFEPAARVGE